MNVDRINELLLEELKEELYKICGSKNWVNMMMRHRPYHSWEYLEGLAELIWFDDCKESDWLEAFSRHPKIGDLDAIERQFASTKNFTESEQSGVNSASRETIEELAEANQAYEKKFGYIFIICATGKSAEEMLSEMRNRLQNDPQTELMIAAGEQYKITKLRLEKYLTE